MRPDKLTVYEIFEKQRRYIVPLFQRPYVWKKEDQWRPLWNDVVDRTTMAASQDTASPHFLGAIVTRQLKVFGNQMNTWEIIDGQQRLTTLQILLKALRDYASASGYGQFVPDLDLLTRNTGLTSHPDERYKLWPTHSDQEAFRDVMNAGSLDVVEAAFPAVKGLRQRRSHPFAESYVFFYGQINGLIEGRDDLGSQEAPVSFSLLFETFRRRLQLVTIELEDGDDPQVIFESLNGRGVPLLPSDLIRNFVFQQAQKAGAPIKAFYQQYWREYDEKPELDAEDESRFWKVAERQGRLTRPRLDIFIFHYLQYRLEREVSIGHLFQEFKTWWMKTGQDDNVERALEELLTYARAFAGWMVPDTNGPVALFATRLRALDTGTVYPLLNFILVEHAATLSVEERLGIVRDLESFLVRRALCGSTAKNYNTVFISLLRNLRKAELSRERFRSLLSAPTGDSVRWPNDRELGRAILHRPVYRGSRSAAIVALSAIDQQLMTSKQERVHIDKRLSLEHVMPRKWRAPDWPAPDGGDTAAESRQLHIDTLGNLTLLTKALNSSASNASFLNKRDKYLRESLLILNKYFVERAAWTDQDVLDRGVYLLNVIRRIWPHPETDSVSDAELSPKLLPDEGSDVDELAEPTLNDAALVGHIQSLLDQYARLDLAHADTEALLGDPDESAH